MKFNASFFLDFEGRNEIIFNLLKEEDFDFKTKNINFIFEKLKQGFKVDIVSNSILELKIGTTALIKSLEVIEKTFNI